MPCLPILHLARSRRIGSLSSDQCFREKMEGATHLIFLARKKSGGSESQVNLDPTPPDHLYLSKFFSQLPSFNQFPINIISISSEDRRTVDLPRSQRSDSCQTSSTVGYLLSSSPLSSCAQEALGSRDIGHSPALLFRSRKGRRKYPHGTSQMLFPQNVTKRVSQPTRSSLFRARRVAESTPSPPASLSLKSNLPSAVHIVSLVAQLNLPQVSRPFSFIIDLHLHTSFLYRRDAVKYCKSILLRNPFRQPRLTLPVQWTAESKTPSEKWRAPPASASRTTLTRSMRPLAALFFAVALPTQPKRSMAGLISSTARLAAPTSVASFACVDQAMLVFLDVCTPAS